MAYGRLLMEKPGGEEQRKVPLGFSWLMLIFGPLVPLFRGQILHFIMSLALFVPTMTISWWTYPIFINFFYRRSLFSKGYLPVEVQGTTNEDVIRRTLIDPFEPSSFKHDSDRVFGRWLSFLAIQAVPIIMVCTIFLYDEQDLQALKAENPTAYLEKIQGREKYWDELKELDPERYESEWPAEQARRETRRQDKLAQVQERNAELAWEGELFSTDVPDGIYCSETYGGGTLEPHERAYFYGREHINDNLTVRGSGNFPVIDYTVIYIDACTYQLHSWFDARNSFNTKMREYYTIYVALDDDEDGGVNVFGFENNVRSRLLRE